MSASRRTQRPAATTLASPFTQKGTHLIAPTFAVPGDAFPCELLVTNESDDRLSGAVVQLQYSNNARLMDGTLAVNGRTVARSLVRPLAEGSVSLKLPALPPQTEARVTWESMVDVPADNASRATVSATVTAMGASCSTEVAIDVQSAVNFDPDHTYFTVEGDNAISVGEGRTLTVHIVNDGTMTAYDAQLCIMPSGFTLRAPIALGDLLPGDAKSVVVDADFASEDDATLTPVLRYDGGAYEFPTRHFVATVGPRFTTTSSFLSRSTDEGLAPIGGRVTVSLTVKNEGERPGAPLAHVILPEHASLLFNGERTPDTAVAFHALAPGEVATQEIIVDVGPCESLEIGARLGGETVLASLFVPVKRETAILPMAFAVTTEQPELRVQEPFGVHLELFSESNCEIDRLDFALDFGPNLSYVDGSLRINGNAYPDESFMRSRSLVFRNIDRGAVIALDWQAIAKRPTLRGSSTAITATFGWDGQRQRAELGGLAIAPRALHVPIEYLPFTIGDVADAPTTFEHIAEATAIRNTSHDLGAALDQRFTSSAEEDRPGTHNAADNVANTRGGVSEQPAETITSLSTTPFTPAHDSAQRAAAVLNFHVDDLQGTPGVDPFEAELAKLGTAQFSDGAHVDLSDDTTSSSPQSEHSALPLQFEAFDPRDTGRMVGLWATVNQEHRNAFGQFAALYFATPIGITSNDAAIVDAFRVGHKRLGKLINSVLMRATSGMEANPQARPSDVEAFCDDAATFVSYMPETFSSRFPSIGNGRPSFAACVSAYAEFVGMQFAEHDLHASGQRFAATLVELLTGHDDLGHADWPAVMQEPGDESVQAEAAVFYGLLGALDGVAA